MEFAGYEIVWRSAGGKRTEARREGLDGIDGDSLSLELSFDGERLRAVADAREAVCIDRFRVLLRHGFAAGERCLLNGWQSWTATDWAGPDARQWGLSRVPRWLVDRYVLDGSGDYRFCPYDARPGHLHGWTWGEVRTAPGGDDEWLVASTDESHGFTLVEMDTRAGAVTLETEAPACELAPGERRELGSYALLRGPRERVFDRWFELMGTRARPVAPLTGYSSWYRHYGDIDDSELLHDLDGAREALDGLRMGRCIPVFQIDDGWAKVGDWLEPDPERFPDGMAAIAGQIGAHAPNGRQLESGFLPRISGCAENACPESGQIEQKTAELREKPGFPASAFPRNLKFAAENRPPAVARQKGSPASRQRRPLVPGLWLAPFVCERDSRLFHQHPGWLLRDELGRPVRTGSHWSGAYALDTRNPRVRGYVREVIRTVTRDWGFRFLKLDFLYAACMLPHDGLNRGELMRDAIDLLRDAAGDDVLLDGCGVPLASAFGKLDYCRIGCDVGLDWDGLPPLRLLERERVSTRHSLACTKSRAPLDGRAFGCDPDVFFLRDDVRLNRRRKRELLESDAASASMLLTSDDMGAWTPEQQSLCQQALDRLSGRKERP